MRNKAADAAAAASAGGASATLQIDAVRWQ